MSDGSLKQAVNELYGMDSATGVRKITANITGHARLSFGLRSAKQGWSATKSLPDISVSLELFKLLRGYGGVDPTILSSIAI